MGNHCGSPSGRRFAGFVLLLISLLGDFVFSDPLKSEFGALRHIDDSVAAGFLDGKDLASDAVVFADRAGYPHEVADFYAH
jgi:hypothetical protein